MSGQTEEDAIDRMHHMSWASHGDTDCRAAVRCGHGDAAALCDALETIILREHMTRGGRGAPSKKGRELAAIAKRCGNAIWALRDRVRSDTETQP